jgi:hypothetical protein
MKKVQFLRKSGLKARFILTMRYLIYYGHPNGFGDICFSCNCDSINEARLIVGGTGVTQRLIVELNDKYTEIAL